MKGLAPGKKTNCHLKRIRQIQKLILTPPPLLFPRNLRVPPPKAANLNPFRAIVPAGTHSDRVVGSPILSLDLGEESPALFTLHTAANSPEYEERASDSEGIAYNPIDFAIEDMYYPVAHGAAPLAHIGAFSLGNVALST